MSFDKLCDEIICEYNGEIKEFACILKLVYLNKLENLDKFNFKKFNIDKKEDLLLYGKNYPLFRSLLYFNEIPLFREEKESILFLKNINISPKTTLNSLNYNKKLKLGNELLKRSISIVPNEYINYIPNILFGAEYYFDGVSLKEYVSNLNGLYKIGKKRKVKELIINKELPNEENVKKYKKILAKKINLFNKKFEKYEVNYFNLKFKNKNYRCQYIYIKQSIWDKILGLFGEGIELKYYPTLVNIVYNNEKVDFLKPFFIFVNKGDIAVYAKVPKLVYLKDNLSLNHLNLKGKYVYFGNWDKDKFYEIIGNI